jgi:hypothetical protein
MKKLLYNSALFLLPVVVIIIGLEVFLGQQSVINSSRKKKTHLEEKASNIENILLGSSQVLQGVNPKIIPSANSFNLANVSQSLYLDAELIKLYLPELKKLKTVFWGINYNSLFLKLSNSPESWRENLYTLEFGIPANRPQNFIESNSYFNVYGLKTSANILRNAGKMDLAPTINEYGFQEVKATGTSNQNAEERIGYHHESMKESHLEENLSYIKNTIELLQKNNIRVVFFTTPTTTDYRYLEKPVFKNSHFKTMDLLESKYGVEYHNFEDLPDFEQDLSYFHDSDHLNEKGAEFFTKILFENLQ